MIKALPDLQSHNLIAKGMTASLLLFVFLAAFTCTAQTRDNYFDRIAMVSDGRLTRFTEFPITVYVEGLNIQGKRYADDLRYALREWTRVSRGMLWFQRVSLPDEADISVSWVSKLESWDREHPLGVAELERKGDKFRVEMRIATRDSTTARPLDSKRMKTVLVHEFGHAIGLWGHSKDPADVMYYASESLQPTPRDSNTLRTAYLHDLNYSLHDQSIKAIKGDMRSKPEDARLHFLLGTVYADKEDYSQAIDSLKRCLSLDPKFHKASVALASVYRASGQDQAALAEYILLAESKPSAMVYNIIGALYYERENTEKAIESFKKALELERIYQPAKRNLFRIYLNRGQDLVEIEMHYAAIQLLLDGIEFFPDKPELHNALGIAYGKIGQFQEARGQYVQALSINPAFMPAKNNLASLYNNQGVEYARSGQWEKSVEAYNEALKLMPDMEEAKKNLSAVHWNRAVGLSKAGNDREAIEAYQQVLRRDPDNMEAHNNLGAVYFRMDNYESAIAEFKSALRSDPEDKSIKDNLAAAYLRHGIDLFEKKAHSQAAEDFKMGLEIAPDNVNLHLGLAQAYEHLARLDDAMRHVKRALTLAPHNAIARKVMANLNTRYGYRALQAENYDQALEYYARVPDELIPPILHNNIGYIYIKKSMYMEAVSEFDRVLKADPGNETAHQNLQSIERSFSQTLSHNLSSQEAKNKLAAVRLSLTMSYTGRGDPARAKSVLKSAVDLRSQDRDLRHRLAEGCMKLAEAFRKANQYEDAREVETWAVRLKVFD